MSQRILGARIVLMISAIVAAGVLFSILTYQYYMRNSSEVQHLAVESIQSTALIKVSDLSQILKNKLDLVSANLQMLSSSQELVDQRFELGKILLKSAQKTTNNFVDFYSWVDSNGTHIWSSSNLNDSSGEKINEFSTAAQIYFEKIKDTHVPAYSNRIELTDGQSGILILYPIIDTQNRTSQNTTNEFRGAILAGISSETLNSSLQSQVPPMVSANLSLVDSSGMMIHTGNPNFDGINVFNKKFDPEIESSINEDIREKNIISIFRSVLQSPRIGSSDTTMNGKEFTVSYAPVVSNGVHYFTILLILPHTLASSLDELVAQQRNFAIMAMTIIAASALGIFFVITYWNKGLRKVVYIQTKELQETTKKLTYHDKLQKEFIDIAAHEFRTPIQSVLAYSEMIYKNLKNFDQYFDKIIRNAKRLEKLTEDVLDVSRIEGKNFQLTKSYFDLDQTINRVIEDHEKEALEKDVKISFESRDNVTNTIYADEARLQQVIDNLLSNAINFTNNGNIMITAYRGNEDNNGKIDDSDKEAVVVEIKDTGTGINPDMMPRLFEKFATRSISGTGLGLYISKSIVDSHGGKIWAYNNKDGKGATFTFALPVDMKSKK
ncbi:MAG TPA: ATP-binding protein [Nitrososphaeraceae archaeon]|nr:ATP-binding protein [Nitrososphaeraceae archaeon]